MLESSHESFQSTSAGHCRNGTPVRVPCPCRYADLLRYFVPISRKYTIRSDTPMAGHLRKWAGADTFATPCRSLIDQWEGLFGSLLHHIDWLKGCRVDSSFLEYTKVQVLYIEQAVLSH